MEIPHPIDQQSRRHGLIISRSESRGQNPEPAPEHISSQICSTAATSQHETVTQDEHLLSSQAGVMDEASISQADAHTREEAAREKQLSGEPDRQGNPRSTEVKGLNQALPPNSRTLRSCSAHVMGTVNGIAWSTKWLSIRPIRPLWSG